MVTIKDIAKRAGVSQGTVSNVLNKKDNVSSEKINRVHKAAQELGYVPNRSAKTLRKGYTNQFHLILPNLRSRAYLDLYQSFKNNADNLGVSVNLLISEDNIEKEIAFLTSLQVELELNMKIALVTSLPYGERFDNIPGLKIDNILFLIRDYVDSKHFITFDYYDAGQTLSSFITEKKYRRICLFMNSITSSTEIAFRSGFDTNCEHGDCNVKIVEIDPMRKYQSIMSSVNEQSFDAFFLSNYDFSESVKDVVINLTHNSSSPIYTVSPVFIMPENDFTKYELNYRLLGHIAAEQMDSEVIEVDSLVLSSDGIRIWRPQTSPHNTNQNLELNLLTVDNPSADILSHLTTLYHKYTNVKINVDVRKYEEVFQILSDEALFSKYDLIRNDINWMSWFAESIFQPLHDIGLNIDLIEDQIIDGILQNHLYQNGKLYALPFSPSTQLLFYRKDLFQNPKFKRLYKEHYQKELIPPTNFDDFNAIAQFFTLSENPASPTPYGATLTLGNTGVAGSEFLCRYFSHNKNLYDDDYNFSFNSHAGISTLRQIRELKKYTDPNFAKWWTDTARSFANGESAMAIMYSNYAPDLLLLESKIIDKIGVAAVPGNNPLIGGGTIGITKTSAHSQEGLNFLKWLTYETISSNAALLGNMSSRKETYNFYEIIDAFPWFIHTKNGIKNSNCRRVPPEFNVKFNERAMLEIIGGATIKTYSADNNMCAVLDEMQLEFETEFSDVLKAIRLGSLNKLGVSHKPNLRTLKKT